MSFKLRPYQLLMASVALQADAERHAKASEAIKDTPDVKSFDYPAWLEGPMYNPILFASEQLTRKLSADLDAELLRAVRVVTKCPTWTPIYDPLPPGFNLVTYAARPGVQELWFNERLLLRVLPVEVAHQQFAITASFNVERFYAQAKA